MMTCLQIIKTVLNNLIGTMSRRGEAGVLHSGYEEMV